MKNPEAEFWAAQMADCVSRLFAEATAKFKGDPMTVKGNGKGDMKEAAHFGDPCIHCHTPHNDVEPGPCPARVSEVAHKEHPCAKCPMAHNAMLFGPCGPCVSELVRIVSELDKTADGVPITPKTELWQAHPQRGWSLRNIPHPWRCGPGWSWQRNSDLPVYSTEEAAREAELC